MKKLLAVCLILMLLLPVGGLAEGTAEVPEISEKLPVNLNYDYDELVVGTTMPMYGAFSFGNWGNAGSDVDVRKLIHGCNLVMWDSAEGGFVLDPSVVSGSLVESDANGDHVYNLILRDDPFYSDGTPITAYDYAFSFLLRMSPVISELGGNPSQMNFLVGYDDYISGKAEALAGIRVAGANQITIRISVAYLPFFYEVGLLDCYPYPISLITPGCEVRDSENGVSLSAALDADILKETLLNSETGYLSHPAVTSGAYKMVSFDGKEAFRTADQETLIQDLADSKFGLLNKVTRAAAIQEGTKLIGETGRYKSTAYARPGLSFIAFNAERVADVTVRQAIAKCLDKSGLTADYAGDYGLAADGFYGIGQWMYQILNGTLEPPVPEDATDEEIQKQEEDWNTVTLDEIAKNEFDPEAAAQMLEDAGWKLNANGIREKDGKALELKMVYPESTPIREILEARFAEPLKQAGIALTLEASDSVLPMYYGQQDRDYDMAWLASNFDVMFDPSPWFAPGAGTNTTGIQDQELYDLAAAMKKTEPGDLLTYCKKWVEFLKKFAEVEPMIPVYSNVYYDFYPDVLQNYLIMANISWSEAVVPSYLSDPPEEVEEAEDAELIGE